MTKKRHVGVYGAVAALLTLALGGPAMAAPSAAAKPPKPIIDDMPKSKSSGMSSLTETWNPIGTEPTLPYPPPADADIPRRGCATTVASPTAPPATSPPAMQIIYAWHEGNGNHYEQYVEKIAKIVDRIDWQLDNSSNYDQHINFSCRSGFDTSTASGYAHALVVPEKIESGNQTGVTDMTVVRDDIIAAGYDDSNRWTFVFEDFAGNSAAYDFCETQGGPWCMGVAELWDGGVVGHEMMHILGAGHAWSKEIGDAYYADIEYGWWDYWMVDQDFNTYYDPSELTATFYRAPYPYPNKINIAAHPLLTAPTCCDVGYSNDLLTAQERTIEADAPYSSPTGFSASGGGWLQVTPPPASDQAVSARYHDGRRSLTMNVQSYAEGSVSVARKIAVSPGTRYKFFTELTTNTSGNVKLRLSWYNSSNALISSSDGATVAVGTGWVERSLAAVAPAGATQVQLSVVSPAGQNFAYQLDSLQLNTCNNPATSDGCRTGI